MREEKVSLAPFLKEIVKSLPDLLRMEQAQGILMAIIKQWGDRNVLPILLNTVRKTGLIGLASLTTDLLRFNLSSAVNLLPNLVTSIWESKGDEIGIICDDQRISFKNFEKNMFRFANGLIDLGLKKGDKVCLVCQNCIEWVEVTIGTFFAGGVCIAANWHETGDTFLNILTVGDPKVLVADEELLIKKVIPLKDKLKSVEQYIVVGERAPEGMTLFKDFIARSSDNQPPAERFTLGINMVTSGTTGHPKSVAHYKVIDNVLSNIASGGKIGAILEYLIYLLAPTYYFGGGEHVMKVWGAGPMYMGAPLQMVFIDFMIHGTPSVFVKRFDPVGMLKMIEEEKVTYIIGVPTHMRRILALPDEVKRRYDLSSLHTFVSGAAPCPGSLKKEFNDFFVEQGYRPVYHEYYASIEMMHHLTILIPKDYVEKPERYESVGKARCGKVVVVDKEGNICPPNKDGRVLAASLGSMFTEYGTIGGKKESIENKLTIINGEKYLDDGIIGRLDEDGFLYFTGRAKELIIPGGVNVYPDEIESTILKHPAVQDVAVIPIPDEDLGEVIGAVVQLREGASATEEEIIKYCREEGLSGYKVPRKVDFWKELPRTEEGKMLKARKIIPRYWEEKGIKRRG